MSAFVASATMINSATAASLGRFHTSDLNNSNNNSTAKTGGIGRQRSSSLTQRAHLTGSTTLLVASRVSPSTTTCKTSYNSGTDSPISTRSRSNTLTNSNGPPAFDNVVWPRRPSVVDRLPNPSIHVVAPEEGASFNSTPLTTPTTTTTATVGGDTAFSSQGGGRSYPIMHSQYPPPPHLPQHSNDSVYFGNTATTTTTPTTTTMMMTAEEEGEDETQSSTKNNIKSTLGDSQLRLGFMPRILILVGLFVMSLGGLYLIAQVLPPLSLPKSIEDVKVDAEILQQFATATYEGWLRTFWVFSVVYLWKQCFGIPGSAFLNILAGALYGPWFGTLLTSALTTVGSVFAYFMSFFLMEPILNRYASSRLDQMRLQIQKKTRSSTSSKTSSSSPSSSSSFSKSIFRSRRTTTTATTTATSTAVETSVTGTRPISDIYSPALSPPTSSSTVAPGQQRGTLRTRSSSFTVRGTSHTNNNNSNSSSDQNVTVNYGYLVNGNHISSASTGPPPMVYSSDDIEVQESEGLLKENQTLDENKNPSTTTIMTSTTTTQDRAYDISSNNGHIIVASEQGEHEEEEEEEEEEEKEGQEDEEDEEEGTSLFMQLLLIRLFPLTPYWFINLASPLVGVPVIPFMTSMFLGCMPYNYICTQAGAILGEIHELRDIYQQPWIMFQIVMVLVLSGGATWASKKWTKKQQQHDLDNGRNKSRSSGEDVHGVAGSNDAGREREEEEEDEASMLLLNGENGSKVEDDGEQVGSYAMASLTKSSERKSHKRDSAIIDMTGYRY